MYCISKVSANPCLSWQQYQDWCEWPNFHFYYGESRRWGITSKVTLSVLPAQSRPTLRDPTDSSPPGSSVHGILQARIQEWVTISFSRGSSWPRDQTRVSRIGGRRFNLTILWSLMKQYLRDSLETLTRQGLQQVGVSLQKTDLNIRNNEEILSITWKSSKKELDLFVSEANKHKE